MTSSMASISRRLCSSILTNLNKPSSHLSSHFCTSLSSPETSDLDYSTVKPEPSPESDSDPHSSPAPSRAESAQQRTVYDRPIENSLDVGIYKINYAILVGQVGQSPLQKRLRSGRIVTLLLVGTGGIRNNRRPLVNEEPREYANWCAVQWHRVSSYPERVVEIIMKHAVPG